MSTQTASLVAITGNTYPVKDQLKAIGARWDGLRKAWMISSDRAADAAAIMADAPMPTRPAFGFAARSTYTQRSRGGVGYCGARGCGRNGCPDCRD